MSRSIRHVLCLSALIVAAVGLAGCQTPVTLTVYEALGLGKGVGQITPNPALRYLRVTGAGRSALMVLGYLDTTPEGDLETWYSNSGEVLQLRDGRIVSTAGLERDWTAVRYTGLPRWAALGPQGSVQFQRLRDEMPGYRFGIAETVILRPLSRPGSVRLVGLPASDLRWYEETVAGRPSARYGLRVKDGQAQVVYGEQCLSEDLCIAWQTWPPTP